MGKTVRFYSPTEGKGHVTSAVCAIGAYLAVVHNKKVVIVKWEDNGDSIRKCFCDDTDTEGYKVENSLFGVNALRLFLKEEKTDREQIMASVVKTSVEGLDLLPGVNAGDREAGDERKFRRLVYEELQKLYDYVLEDAPNHGITHFENVTDICMLPQNYTEWEDCVRKGEKDRICVINAYVKGSVSNSRRFALRYGNKLFTMPFSVGFMDALAGGRLGGFIEMCDFLGKLNPDRDFFRSIGKIAEEIMERGEYAV